MIGITGTNGKTTTAFLTRQILERSGVQTGLLGTVKRVVGGIEEEVERTTPEAIDLQATFRRMVELGDRACAMEVSSHALALKRADGIRFKVAAFTNLTQDHLDFHADMEDYFQAKRRLFVAAGAERQVVNLDDPYGERLVAELDAVHLLGERLGGRRLPGDRGALRRPGVALSLPGAGRRGRGRAAASGGLQRRQRALRDRLGGALGIGVGDAAAALADAERVPGRFEPVDEGQPFAVLVDYAHTPDSLQNVLEAARELTPPGPAPGGGVRRRRRPRPRQASADGRDRGHARRSGDRDLRQPAIRGPVAIVDEIVAGMPSGAGRDRGRAGSAGGDRAGAGRPRRRATRW